MESALRTAVQKEKLANAIASGYKWRRDSEYKLRRHGAKGCLIIMTGRPFGSNRVLMIYPDGATDTQAQKGLTSNCSISRRKMTLALQTHGHLPAMIRRVTLPVEMAYTDEDLVFN